MAYWDYVKRCMIDGQIKQSADRGVLESADRHGTESHGDRLEMNILTGVADFYIDVSIAPVAVSPCNPLIDGGDDDVERRFADKPLSQRGACQAVAHIPVNDFYHSVVIRTIVIYTVGSDQKKLKRIKRPG